MDLKKVENFKYLGRQICDTDSDSPALFMNLCKVRKRLHGVFCLTARESADPVVGGKIYISIDSHISTVVWVRDLGVEP